MPAVAQMQRPQRQGFWTQTNSTTVVKNLVRTSISQICYLRAIFPEKCFSLKNYADDLPIHALTPAREVEGSDQHEIIDEQAWKLTRWLEEGVFVALEKQYLKSMTFGVFTYDRNKKPRSLVESYCYEVSYPEAGKVGLVAWASGYPCLISRMCGYIRPSCTWHAPRVTVKPRSLIART